jgi:hypothetical protein
MILNHFFLIFAAYAHSPVTERLIRHQFAGQGLRCPSGLPALYNSCSKRLV